MSAKKKPRPEPRHIPAFSGTRSRPGARQTRTEGTGQAYPIERQATLQEGAQQQTRPDELFEQLSKKVADQTEKAATTAGRKATREITQALTVTLDEAIADAMRAAATVGAIVRREVQAAVDDTLRNAVLDATRIREQGLAQLALIDRTARTSQDLAAVLLRLDAELQRSGLTRITVADPERFELVNPDEHLGSVAFEVTAPAYVERDTGRTVQLGEMRRLPREAAPVRDTGQNGQQEP